METTICHMPYVYVHIHLYIYIYVCTHTHGKYTVDCTSSKTIARAWILQGIQGLEPIP